MAGESKTSRRRMVARERWAQALQLRIQGLTFAAIAEELNYAGRPQAYTAVMKALKETLREPADKLRALEAERLDTLTEALWGNAEEGNNAAVDRILRIMERRAKLLGLDLPVTQGVDLTVKGPLVIIRKSKEAEDEGQADSGRVD